LVKALLQRHWLNLSALAGWIGIGIGLRFSQLEAKPPWNDELATLVFSLGNGLYSLPLDQPIPLEALLAPLRPNPDHQINDVIHRLFTESTHPPLYFVLTHLWLSLFPTDQGLVSVWAARSLSALFGVLAIPALFSLGSLVFRSRWAGHFAAALMAISPYGIYLAQEARHYTLAVLFIIASLSCLMVAIRGMGNRPLPLGVCLVWVLLNGLGVAVHYFFALILVAEAIALGVVWLMAGRLKSQQLSQQSSQELIKQNQALQTPARPNLSLWSTQGLRLYAVALGTVGSVLIWIPVWQSISDNELTQWIYDENFLSNGIGPLYRLFAWMVTMVALLPVEGVSTGIAIACAVVLLFSVGWIGWAVRQGLQQRLLDAYSRRPTQGLVAIWLTALILILGLAYGFHADLTIAARYQFIYFPALLTLIAGAIATTPASPQALLLILLGFLGSLTVISNYGYQKPDRPDQLVPIIRATSQVPILIATAHQTHEQTRELMGLALEYRRQSGSAEDAPPQFLLAHLDPNSNTAVTVLQKTANQLPRPFDLWTVNFLPMVQPNVPSCKLDVTDRPKMHGYDYRLYHCE
jgi:uncharacterized membrane protein